MAHDSTPSEFDRILRTTTERCGAPLCVGIDPVMERLPEPLAALPPHEAFAQFSTGVVDAVQPFAATVKFQSACFERFGARGLEALESSISHAREAGLAVILDAKRGDIGISATHYAAAAASLGAHAVTVNAYLGMETVEPYLDAGLAIFVLVRTSNPGSTDVQDVTVRGGGTVAMHMGRLVSELGTKRPGVHAVVGATQHDQAHVLRAVMPDQVFLLPGLGAQGATAADIAEFARPAEHVAGDPTRGLLPTASRSVTYPDEAPGDPSRWTERVSKAASALQGQLVDALATSSSAGA
ncbi:MAG: orotidine-5'-phosphate decarboxylase [Planctomycetota bacterium]